MTTWVDKNFVTDFGAVPGTDIKSAIQAFKAYAQTQTDANGVRLTVPGLSNEQYPLVTGDTEDANLFRGVPLLHVIGTGHPTFVGDIYLGGFSRPTTNETSARIETAYRGATQVRLVSSADVFKFLAGRTITLSNGIVYRYDGKTVELTGIDLQGFGDPNTQYQQFNEIVAFDQTTRWITLKYPLEFDLLSTWPLYNPGAASGASGDDNGGPATIYAVDWSWPVDHTYQNVWFKRTGQQIHAFGKRIRFLGGGCESPEGLYPSRNTYHEQTGFDQSALGFSLEIDKSVTEFVVGKGTVFATNLYCQSINNILMMDHATIPVLNGSPKITIMDSCNISQIYIGPVFYGVAEKIIARNSSIGSIVASGPVDDDILNPSNGWTISGGVIKRAKTFGPVRWAIPGAFCTFRGQVDSETGFKVLSVYEDGTYTYVQTSLTGGWPDVPLQGGTRLDIRVWPAMICCFTNCIGSADTVDLSNPGAFGRPLYTYSKRQHTGSAQNPQGPIMWGYAQAININVIQAYTGSGPLTIDIFGQFSGVLVDCRQTGLRQVGQSSVIGAKSAIDANRPGDTLGPLGTTQWLGTRYSPYFSADVSGQAAGVRPIVEVEWVSNLGIAEKKVVLCQGV